MKTYNISTTSGNVKVVTENISDILSSAIYGGIGYWACIDDTTPEFIINSFNNDDSYEEICTRILLHGGHILIIDIWEEYGIYSLTLENLLTGIKRWIESGMDRYGTVSGNELDCCCIDSECADCIIQLALFDDIVYG